MIIPEKLTSIERALVAAATMDPHDARNVLRLICEGGMTSGSAVTFEVKQVTPNPGQVHYAKRERFIKRMQSACDRVLDYAKHETLRNVEKHFRDSGIKSAEGDTTPTTARITF